ncbi:MAG: cadherin repeat domain-containing protein, partial [Gemmatimonadota bacterium]|nr:cadherin repeat domain-containing protein [Gemmatimonadota bacterium]
TTPRIAGPSGSAGATASAKSIPEGTTAVHTFTASEEVTWTLGGGVDAAKFAINPATGALTLRATPDFEAPTDADGNNTYIVVVTATDAGGNVSSQTVTVTITDIDDTAPSITGPSGAAAAATSAKSIAENTTAVHTFTANESVTWSLTGGADAGKFTINATTGALTFTSAPDFEAPTDLGDGATNNTYVVIVKAVDAAGNISTQTVTVTVTNVDDTAPAITGPSGAAGAAISAKSIAENTTAVHTFTANESVTWSLDGGADAAKFSINAATGALTFKVAPDFEAPNDAGDGERNNTYVVVIKAVDALGNASTQTVTITVTDVDEVAPVITGPSGAAGATTSAKSIAENTTAVHTFTANESVTWSLDGGADAAKFTINATTGALTFIAGPDFESPTDADGNNTYIVVVKAVDALGNVSTQTLTVTITNVDETAPAITGPSGAAGAATSAKSIAENTTAVHTFTASEDVTWSLDGGADAAKFSINAATGALTFKVAPDFEAPNDAGDGANNNTYVVVIKAVDVSGLVSTQTVTVTVTNVDDTAPAITGPSGAAGAAISAKSIAENTTAVHTFTASEDVTWSLDGGADAAKFSIDATTGALGFLSAPNFEAPTDAGDGANNNTYVVVIKAVDAAGLISTQTVTVTVTNVDETTGAFSRVVCTESQPAGQSAAASVTVTLCAATRAGDLEIVTLALDGTDDVTAPSGGLDGTWTKISSVSQSSGSGGNKSMLLINYARRYADGLNRTVTFTGATNHKWSVDMVTFVSAGTGVPTGAEIQTSQNTTGSSLTSPGLTATAENTIVYYVMANSLTGNTVSATNQGTLTSLSNNNSGGTSSTAFIELLASSATAPSRTWTSTKSANSVLLQLLVRP